MPGLLGRCDVGLPDEEGRMSRVLSEAEGLPEALACFAAMNCSACGNPIVPEGGCWACAGAREALRDLLHSLTVARAALGAALEHVSLPFTAHAQKVYRQWREALGRP